MAVWCGRYGSGYLVAPDLVLTAAHVVEDAARVGTRVQVQPLDATDAESWLPCDVAWIRDDNGVDAALLRITAAPGRAPAVPEVQRWGRLTGTDPGIPWQAVGFPDVAPDVAGLRESEHLSGTLNPGSRRRGRRYAALISATAPGDLGDSPWSGTSGAAMFCGDLLTGVVVVDPAHWRHGRVEAVPIQLLSEDAAFRALIEKATGLPLAVESVELADTLAAPAPHRPVTPMGLLRADAEVAPFHGRIELLARCENWCTAPADAAEVSLRLLTGPGGQGKTRFALELIRRMRRHGWVAGRLTEAEPDGEAARALVHAQAPVLVVVDYAEGRAAALHTLLIALSRRTSGSPLRLLLMARGTGEWWTTLRAAHPLVRDLAGPDAEYALPPLHADGSYTFEDRRRAMYAFATALSGLRDYGPCDNTVDWHAAADRLLALPVPKNPTAPGAGPTDPSSALEEQMGLLAALLQAGPRPVPQQTGGVEDVLLEHERRYGQQAARARGLALSDRVLSRALTAAALVRPEHESDALTLFAAMPGLRDLTEDRRLDLTACLGDLYPPGERRAQWGSPQPDRLAEHLVTTSLRETPDLLDRFLPALRGSLCYQAFTVLGRGWLQESAMGDAVTRVIAAHGRALAPAAVAAVGVLTDPRPVVRAVDALLSAKEIDAGLLVDLLQAVPQHSEALAEHALLMADRLVNGLMPVLEGAREQVLPPLAVALEQLAWRLTFEYHDERSDQLLWQFHMVAETLVREQGEQHLMWLVSALNLRALYATECEQFEQAFELADEAVRRGRALLDAPQGRTRLLGALNTLGVALSSLDRHDDAVEAFREVGRLADDTTDESPPWSRSTGWRGNLARELSMTGRHKEAATQFAQTLAEARDRAARLPDTGRAELGTVLMMAGHSHLVAGRTAKAIAVIEEGLPILRSLVAQRPGPHSRTLVRGLVMRATCALAQSDEATRMTVLDEAHRLCRRRAPHDPAIQLLLVDVLGMLYELHAKRGEQRLALRAANGAVQLLLDQDGPDDSRRAQLLDALLTLDHAYADFHAPDRATATLEAALALYEDGVRSPTYDELDRSDLLNRRGNRRAAAGDHAGGLADLTEAVRLRRAAAERDPAKQLRLALTLNDLAHYELEDRPQRVVDSLEEALRILRAEHRRGTVSTYKLVGTQMNLASALRYAERADESLVVIEGALASWNPVASTGRQDQELLAMLWTFRAQTLYALDRAADTLHAADRALAVYERLTRDGHPPVDPATFGLALVRRGTAVLDLYSGDKEKLRDGAHTLLNALQLAANLGRQDLAAAALTALQEAGIKVTAG
ncbi:trypsin-like peptidase domain-containing protein [Streptomyces sp. NPDC005149]